MISFNRSNCKSFALNHETITYLRLKANLKKLPAMTNNTLTRTLVLLTLITYDILTFIIYTNICLGKLMGNIFCLHEKEI